MNLLRSTATAATMRRVIVSALLPLAAATASHAQITIAPAFAASYSFVNLGSPAGVATSYGGLTISATNPNTLLIGASANNTSSTIDSVSLTRSLVNGKNRITGFTGTASVVSTATGGGGGGIDGGLAYGPNNVLFFASYPDNVLGEIKSGSTSPDKQISLTTPGVVSSTGGLQFVRSGLPNAGKLWISSFNGGDIYETSVTADGSGTYNIGTLTDLGTVGSGPEGIIFVPAGSPGFATASVLVSKYGNGSIDAYQLDASGHPIIASAQAFITGLTGAEGGTIDASTGDLLFSTFSGTGQVIAVRGFASAATPEPGNLLLIGAGLPLLVGGIVRRKANRAA